MNIHDATAMHSVKLLVHCLALGAAKALSTTPFIETTTRALHNLDRATVRAVQVEKERKLRSVHNNRIFNALFINVPERPAPVPLSVSATEALPSLFPPGCLLRLGPNGAPANEGFMDGDGFVYCITFPPKDFAASGTFSSTYVDTRGRRLEKASPGKRFLGTLGSAPRGLPLLGNVILNAIRFRTLQCQKDTCNTALAEHGGRVLALMEQCPPSEIQVHRGGSVSTIAANCHLDGAVPTDDITGGSMSAHGRTCAVTGERIHVSYSSARAPYVRVDTYDAAGWQLQRTVAIDVACPTMLHDCAVTANYVVIFDFPLTLRTSRFWEDKFPIEYEPSYGARIGLLPRNATTDETIWFDCEPGVVLHAVNAYEKSDNTVTVQVLRSEPSTAQAFIVEYSPSFLYEYELDVSTKTVVTEKCLNPYEPVEFPAINNKFVGKAVDGVYCSSLRSIGGPLASHRQPLTGTSLDGVNKFCLSESPDHTKGSLEGKYSLPPSWFGVSEPTVVPKTDGTGEFVLLIASQVPERDAGHIRSQVMILDGNDLDAGPVWTSDLPHHVHYGLHSMFLEWNDMV